MITAVIRNKENTLVLELPHSIYDIYEKLQSIGIMQPPKRIPLTDNEDEDIGVKLFSESDFGQHLLLTLNEKNTIADANMLTLVIGAASEDIKEELEQNILYDQYDSMDEVINAVRQMTQDAGPVKAVFFCPLVGNIDEGDGDMFTVGDSYLADSADEIVDALNRYTANDENDMAAYYNKDDGVSEKLTSAVWSVELHGDRLFGRIDCSLKEALTAEETEALRDWLTGQCSDGLGEGFEQQPMICPPFTANLITAGSSVSSPARTPSASSPMRSLPRNRTTVRTWTRTTAPSWECRRKPIGTRYSYTAAAGRYATQGSRRA